MTRQRLGLRAWPGAALLACAVGFVPAAQAADAPARELVVCADPSNLPFSNARQEGFENRIASLIARDLDVSLRYAWNMQRRSFLRRTLHAGACDVVMGVPAGLQGVVSSRPYYASSYVFVTASDRHLTLRGFDDPALRDLRIGLQALGAEGANTPPASALARRGIVDRIVGFPMWGAEDDESPPAHIVDAVASGAIDTAIVWGPFAGYFARAHAGKLTITPVLGDPQQPALAFRYEMSLGVRRGDDDLLKALQGVLDRRQAEVQAILREYGIPLVAVAEAPSGGDVIRVADSKGN